MTDREHATALLEELKSYHVIPERRGELLRRYKAMRQALEDIVNTCQTLQTHPNPELEEVRGWIPVDMVYSCVKRTLKKARGRR